MLSWRAAAERALYGPDGFYLRERAEDHFRTSVHVSPLFAAAVVRLLQDVDAALGHPARLDVVDMAAGSGSLLRGIRAELPADVLSRVNAVAVELTARPAEDGITWTTALPEQVTGLIVANEWLDNVPLEVVERTQDGPRLVLVDPQGAETHGPPPDPADLAWLDRWWPEGDRAEIGRTRDLAWADLVARLAAGVAVAIDYAHDLRSRRPTLMGYRGGSAVPAVPDGTRDLTAHVALDACAVPGLETVLTTQRDALRALGVSGARPPRELALSDPRSYVRALSRAGEAAELIDPSGLGAFGWLMQAKGDVSLRSYAEAISRPTI